MDIKKTISNTISDVMAKFLYYDRKECEDLPQGAIEKAIEDGVITKEEICQMFIDEIFSEKEYSVNRILRTYQKALRLKEERDWDRIYVAVDIHETIMLPNHGGISTEYYDYAVDVLRWMSEQPDIKLIMWTCSTAEHRGIYYRRFAKKGILFDYINGNPEVVGWHETADYEDKMYANLVLDDKAGFEPLVDWKVLYDYIALDKLIKQHTR